MVNPALFDNSFLQSHPMATPSVRFFFQQMRGNKFEEKRVYLVFNRIFKGSLAISFASACFFAQRGVLPSMLALSSISFGASVTGLFSLWQMKRWKVFLEREDRHERAIELACEILEIAEKIRRNAEQQNLGMELFFDRDPRVFSLDIQNHPIVTFSEDVGSRNYLPAL